MTISEENILKGCQKGDRKMQQHLYEIYSGKLLVICHRYSKLQQEAEDILQESFVKIFNNIKKFRNDSSLWFWMKKITVNTALNYHRSKLYLYPMVDVEMIYEEPSEENLLSFYHFKELLQMIQELPVGCQIIFNLYAIEGYKHHEIAERLGISEGTSKSQYARAKQLLKDKIAAAETFKYVGIK